MYLRNSFDPRSFAPVSWAPGDESGVPENELNKAFWQAMMDAGSAGTNRPAQRNFYVERLNADFERKSRLQRDDTLATEFIAALLQMEMLDG